MKFNIGLDEYPLFDENYRPILNQKIIDHYYFREIGFETAAHFRQRLKSKMSLIMPKYNRLYDTQQVRSKGDYITGMKLIKALCDTYGRKLYTGRVKGVITALIGNREEEIKNFKPKDFYSIAGKKSDIELKHFYYEEQEDENSEETFGFTDDEKIVG